jgi:hypothetical protein
MSFVSQNIFTFALPEKNRSIISKKVHDSFQRGESRVPMTIFRLIKIQKKNINKAIMGPSTQQSFFSSSDVIATTCFCHTTIIKWHTVSSCSPL